jgi:hypothetical protein
MRLFELGAALSHRKMANKAFAAGVVDAKQSERTMLLICPSLACAALNCARSAAFNALRAHAI